MKKEELEKKIAELQGKLESITPDMSDREVFFALGEIRALMNQLQEMI